MSRVTSLLHIVGADKWHYGKVNAPTASWLLRLVDHIWPEIAEATVPAMTQTGKHSLHLNLNSETRLKCWARLFELFKAATVFLSGQQYLTR